MKTYRWQSQSEGLERFLYGKRDFDTWFRRNVETCMFYIDHMADRDNVKSETLNYDFEFSVLRWDIEFVVTGRPYT